VKPRNRLKKAYLVLLFLGVSYLWVSIILFFWIATIKTSLWGFDFIFIYLTDPFRISFILISAGISLGVLDLLCRGLKNFPLKSLLPSSIIITKLIRFGKKQISHCDYRLLVILFLGAIVRYWGITFGLPETFSRPDEEVIVNTSLKFFQGDFNPEFFRYPTLYMYLLFAVFKIYLLFQNMKGLPVIIPDYRIAYQDLSEYYLLDRAFSAFWGTLSILVVYKLAKTYFDRKVALASSFLFAFAYLHVRDSHFGVTDIPLTFFILCSVFFILKSYQEKNTKNYLIAGLLSGLTASIKYNGFLLIVPMGLVHTINVFDKKESITKLFFDERILLFFSAITFTFLLGTPYAYLEFNKFINHFLFEMSHLQEGHRINLGRGWWYHFRFSLFYGLGGSLFGLSLAGMLVMFKQNFKKAVVFCSFPIFYFLIAGKGYTVFVRYVLPLLPFLCISAAFLLILLVNQDFVKKRIYKKLILITAIAVLTGPNLYNIIRFDLLLQKEDSRILAKEWIQKHSLEGTSIFQTGGGIGKINFSPEVRELKYIEKENKYYFKDKEVKILPDQIIVKKHPLKIYSEVPENVQILCDEKYHLVKSIEVIELENPYNLFDQQDAFYVPLVGFRNISNPGPNIFIFQKRP
jgi:hypothetical protein